MKAIQQPNSVIDREYPDLETLSEFVEVDYFIYQEWLENQPDNNHEINKRDIADPCAYIHSIC